MKKEEMREKVEAGENPVDVSIEKYRELQCKILADEEVTINDIQGTTCALCYAYGDNFDCSTCPLYLAGHNCRMSGSIWRKLFTLIDDDAPKQQILDAMDDMIAAIKESRLYEENTKTSEETEKDMYIEGEKNCGLKVGDTVKITRTAEYGEGGWSNSWVEDKMFAGKIGKVTSIQVSDNASGIAVNIGSEGIVDYDYPYFVLEKIEEKTYCIGQRFQFNGEEKYILAKIDMHHVNLIRLDSGTRWADHQKVSDINEITETEMKELANTFGYWEKFELIE